MNVEERIGAALPHVGYLPVAAAFLAAAIQPTLIVPMLVLAVLWTVFAFAVLFERQPDSAFVARHLQQARRYHRGGVVAAASILTMVIYCSIFTWGGAAVAAAFILPVVLLMWLIPTWKAAFRALHGQEYEYPAHEWMQRKQDLTVAGTGGTSRV